MVDRNRVALWHAIYGTIGKVISYIPKVYPLNTLLNNIQVKLSKAVQKYSSISTLHRKTLYCELIVYCICRLTFNVRLGYCFTKVVNSETITAAWQKTVHSKMRHFTLPVLL